MKECWSRGFAPAGGPARPICRFALAFLWVLLAQTPATAEDPDTPTRGSFLVAARELVDPNFRETVVLMLEYGSEGAIGLVVNRPSKVPLSQLIPYIPEFRGSSDTVYIGGPVDPVRMFFLFRSSDRQDEALLVFDDVWASSSFDLLEQTLDRGGSPVRVLSGYAGWAPSQLDAEIGRGDWHILPANIDELFTMEPDELWGELIQRAELRVARLE
jgi:putative transcriptional regulator